MFLFRRSCFMLLAELMLVLSHNAFADARVVHIPLRRVSQQSPAEFPHVDPRVFLKEASRSHGLDLDLWDESVGAPLTEPAIAKNSSIIADASTVLASVGVFRRTLHNSLNMIYMAHVTVGTPGKVQNLIFDTGSSDLWVTTPKPGLWATLTDESTKKMGYNPKTSMTAQPTKFHKDSVQYGQGFISGPEVMDKVCLGAAVCNPHQTLIFANKVKDLPNINFDGLLGMAFPALQSTHGPTFLEGVLEGGAFQHPAFGLAMHKSNQKSSVVIGNLEDVKKAGPKGGFGGVACAVLAIESPMISILPVPAYWMVSTSLSVLEDGKDKALVVDRAMALDSGTSLIAAPAKDFKVLLKAMFATSNGLCVSARSLAASLPKGLVVCYCNATLPTLTFTMRGVDGRTVAFPLTSADYLQEAMTTTQGDALCLLGIMPGPDTIPIWILGDVFIRKAGYIVHDVENLQMVLHPPQETRRTDKQVLASQGYADARASESDRQRSLGGLSVVCLAGIAVFGIAAFAFVGWKRSPSRAMPAHADSYCRL